jgi:hypothetical protein
MYYIEGSLLHQLNQNSEHKSWTIQIAHKKFQYSKVQVALLSPIAFKYFTHQQEPFRIEIPSDYQVNDVVYCYEQLDSLLRTTAELSLSDSNMRIFSFIAAYLDNRFLMKKCRLVPANRIQYFKLSSRQLMYFPKS